MCGRGVGPSSAAALAQETSPHQPCLPNLEALALRGAYRLEDASLEKVRFYHVHARHSGSTETATVAGLGSKRLHASSSWRPWPEGHLQPGAGVVTWAALGCWLRTQP